MTARPRYPRSTCCVIGCRRTSTLFQGEWVCGDHWRLIDRSLKTIRTKLNCRWKKRWETARAQVDWARGVTAFNATPTPDSYWPEDIQRELSMALALRQADRAWRRGHAGIWRRMKRQATERALGISA